MRTLSQWAAQYGHVPSSHTDDVVSVTRPLLTPEAERELWHLSDYTVTTAGPTIWLCPKAT